MSHILSRQFFASWAKISLVSLLISLNATSSVITKDVLKADKPLNNETELSMFELLPVNLTTKKNSDKHLHTIVTLLDTGNYAQALKYMEQNTSHIGDNPIIQELQAAALAKTGDIHQAVALLNKIKLSHPLQYSALTKLGDIYLYQGKQSEAQALFEDSARIAPSFRFNHQRLGKIYQNQGLQQQALRSYEKGLIGTHPEYIGMKVDLAGLLVDMGQPKRAIALLSPFDSATKNKLGFSGHLVLGLSYLNLGYFEQAKKQFDLSATIRPNAIGPLYAYAKMYKAQKQYDDALELYNKAVAKRPDLLSLRLELADTYFTIGKTSNAIQELKTAREEARPQWPVTELIIQALSKQQQYPEAFKETLALYRAKPHNLYLERLGKLAQHIADKQSVIKALKQLSVDSPEPAEVFYILSIFFSYHKNYTEGLESVNHSLKLAPDVTKYLKAKSLNLLRLGQKEQALVVVKKMQNNKDSHSENFYMGTIFEINKKYNSAKTLYKKALAAQPDNVLILNNLAWVEQQSGEFVDALITAEKAYALNQSNHAIMDTYGWILFLNNQYDKAHTILSKAVDTNKPDPNTLYRLARVEMARENFQNAKNHLLLALSNDNSFETKSAATELLASL